MDEEEKSISFTQYELSDLYRVLKAEIKHYKDIVESDPDNYHLQLVNFHVVGNYEKLLEKVSKKLLEFKP